MASSSDGRIARNSIILYLRMVLMMLISLYTSRVVLNALGVDGFGVYTTIGGFVSLFTLVSYTLSSSISRYLAFEMGRGRNERLRSVFSTSVILLLGVCVLVMLLVETIGVWFVADEMEMPADLKNASLWVLQFSAVTFVLNLLSVPYNAAIIAHEKMTAYAYISLLDSAGKLGVAFMISCFNEHLVAYAAMLMVWALLIRIIYALYCSRKFSYCRLEFRFDRQLLKEMSGFSGWSFLGTASAVVRDQGVTILINVFCGAAVSAARGITIQVNNAVRNFSTSFTTAFNPQIIKRYASGDTEGWSSLAFRGCRFGFFMMLIPGLPILLEAHKILLIWLKILPPYTTVFVQLVILVVLIESMTYTLDTIAMASGKVRVYQLATGTLQLLNFPLSWIFLRLGYSPQVTLVIAIAIAVTSLALKLLILNRQVGLRVGLFCRDVLLRVAGVLLLASVVPVALLLSMPESTMRFILVCVSAVCAVCVASFFVGCNKSERNSVKYKLREMLGKRLKPSCNK